MADIVGMGGRAAESTDPSKWPALAGVVADVVVKKDVPLRRVHLLVSYACPPNDVWSKRARFWEADVHIDTESIEWLLESQETITCVEDALQLLRSRSDLVVWLGCR
jgi:hypothetical protein